MINSYPRTAVPCDHDRDPPFNEGCAEEATHVTPSGKLYCTEHAKVHNQRMFSNRLINKPGTIEKYLAVPK